MSLRRLLLAVGNGGPPVVVPPDPTLVEPRAVTVPQAMNINGSPTTPTGGRTWQNPPELIKEDAASIRLGFIGIIDAGQTIKVSIRKGDTGPFTPVLFSGVDSVTIADDTGVLSDAIAGPFSQGDEVTIRAYAAAGQTVNVINKSATVMDGADHRATLSWVPTDGFTQSGPYPVIFTGLSREAVVSAGVLGDSIAAQQSWFTQACADNNLTGANYGLNVQRFTGRWIGGGVIDGLTHMLVQFGVNDINSGISGAALWEDAVECYAYIDSLHPGLPIWQTTTTPIVSDTAGDGCATLDGQTLDTTVAANRQAWIAFLRDGAPCHPTTLAALLPGATGTVIRAGHPNHPLRGIVDIASAVEHGDTEAPTGKWRVDLGPLGGDGVHPSTLGMEAMVPPVSDWLATLTAPYMPPDPEPEPTYASVYGDTPPPGTHTLYTDNGEPITLAQTFRRSTGSPIPDDANIVGGRVYLPSAAPGSTAVKIMLWEGSLDLATAPDREATVPLNGATGWVEGIFDTPFPIPGIFTPYRIGYTFIGNPATYIYAPNFRTGAVPVSPQANGIEVTEGFSSYRSGSSAQGNANSIDVGYGVDILID